MELKYDKVNQYYLINNIIKIDVEDSLLINNLKNKNNGCLNFVDDKWIYNNYKNKIKLIDILFPDEKIVSYKFINNDYNDYRRENIELECDSRYYDSFDDPPEYNIINKGVSHKVNHGKFSGQYRNMYWKVELNNETFYLMHIMNDIYTKISKRDIKKVLNYDNVRPFWYIQNQGYIATTIRQEEKTIFLYLHQYIMDVHNEDLTDYEKTVDHINRDKLDNRRTNLRFATMTEQNTNKDKATRRCDAKTDLPIWLDELPKYVQYRKEIYDKVNNTAREFFIIQHPNQDKIWESSKSNNVQLIDKFKATKLKLQLLDNMITETQYIKESGLNTVLDLPVGITILDKEGKYYFIYDYKSHSNRYNFKRTIQTNNIQNELDTFISDMNIKYPSLNYPNYIIKNQYAVNFTNKQIKPKNNEKLVISDEIELPLNFTIYTEKNIKYIMFSKKINKIKYQMKKAIKTNIKDEVNMLIERINDKYSLQLLKI
jgi:hypothetical protein